MSDNLITEFDQFVLDEKEKAATKLTRIGAANSIAGHFLKKMPNVIEGECPVEYLDRRGVKQMKFEKKTDLAWALALTSIVTNGFTNSILLYGLLKKHLPEEMDLDSADDGWDTEYQTIQEAKEELGKYTAADKIAYSESYLMSIVDTIKPLLVNYEIIPMVSYVDKIWEESEELYPMIQKRSEVAEYTDADGVRSKHKVWKVTEAMETYITCTLARMKDNITTSLPLCPFKPEPWLNRKTGVNQYYTRVLCRHDAPVYERGKRVSREIDERFDTGQHFDRYGKRLGNWSTDVLEAINKLQDVPVCFTEEGKKFALVRAWNKDKYKPDVSGLDRITAQEKMQKYQSQCLLYDKASHLTPGVPLYQALSFDHRGRIYYLAGLVTTQGTGFSKSNLKFANSVSLLEE